MAGLAISREDAVTRVKTQCAADQEPTLDDDAVGTVVDRSARMDADGNTIDSDDWTATYDLDAATALAWERKAALTATAKFDVSIDGQTLTRSQIYDHCTAEARRYRNRIVSAVRRTAPSDP